MTVAHDPETLRNRPLAGLRVLDLSRLLPGPFATLVLGDLGAEVDKVEDPGAGDYLRNMPPLVGGMGATFHLLNRGKRSLVLDLKQKAGQDALLRVIAKYDVLVETFRPGVMDRLGLGFERLRAVNRGLVYCAISGYGQTGPLAHHAGHDINYLARAGVLGLTGPEDRPPQVPGFQVADIGGGALFAVAGILAALRARESTGEGRFVDVSMCEGSLLFGAFGISSALGGMPFLHGSGPLAGGIAPFCTYRTKDGRYVALGALEPKFWMAFCSGVGVEAGMDALMPGPHQGDWKARLGVIFEDRTLAEWVEFAKMNDCCLEPVLLPSELEADPQHAAREMFKTLPTRDGTPLTQIRVPIAEPPTTGAAPERGEHTVAVLRDAGFDDAAIAALKKSGVLG